MKIYIKIEEPRPFTDTYGRTIKGPVVPLLPFETINKAIEWLEMISHSMEESRQ